LHRRANGDSSGSGSRDPDPFFVYRREETMPRSEADDIARTLGMMSFNRKRVRVVNASQGLKGKKPPYVQIDFVTLLNGRRAGRPRVQLVISEGGGEGTVIYPVVRARHRPVTKLWCAVWDRQEEAAAMIRSLKETPPDERLYQPLFDWVCEKEQDFALICAKVVPLLRLDDE